MLYKNNFNFLKLNIWQVKIKIENILLLEIIYHRSILNYILITNNMTSMHNIRSSSEINNTCVSLCIPYLPVGRNRPGSEFSNWRKIKQLFISLHWGFIERVDVIRPNRRSKRAFIHFAEGKFTNNNILNALTEGKDIKIQYDEQDEKELWWLVRLSRSTKPAEAPKPKFRPSFEIVNGKVLGKPRVAKKIGGRKPVLDIDDNISIESNEKGKTDNTSTISTEPAWPFITPEDLREIAILITHPVDEI